MFNYLTLKHSTLLKINGVNNITKSLTKKLIIDVKLKENNNLIVFFQFYYNLINILLKIFRILNFLYTKNLTVSRYLKQYSINNYINQTIFLNNIWNSQKSLSKKSFKKYFYNPSVFFTKDNKFLFLNNYKITRNLYQGETLFKSILYKKSLTTFKWYKKKPYNLILEQLRLRRKLKKQQLRTKLRYSRKKRRLIFSKKSYYYRYPAKLWSFFKWLKSNFLLKPILFHQKFKKNFFYKKKIFNLNSFFKENFFDIPKKSKYKKILNPLLNKKLLFYKTWNFNRKKKKYHKLLKNKFIYNQTSYCFNVLYRSKFKYRNFSKIKPKRLKTKIKLLKKHNYKSYFFTLKIFKTFLAGFNFNNVKKININLKSNFFYFNGYCFNKLKTCHFYNYKRNTLYFLLTKLCQEVIYFKTKKNILITYFPKFCVEKVGYLNLNIYKKFIIYSLFLKFLRFENSKYKYTFLGQDKIKNFKQQIFKLYFLNIKLNSNKINHQSKFFLNYSKYQNIKYLNNLLF